MTLGGNVLGNANSSNLTPATISGNLALGATQDIRRSTGQPRQCPGHPISDMIISAVISGSGQGINKVDTGTLQLTANNTYTGATTVSFGDLQVDGSLIGNAVQTVSFSGNPTGGTFTLALGGATTGAISYSNVASTLGGNVQTALNALATIGSRNSATATTAGINAVQTITFGGTITGGTFTLTFVGKTTTAINYTNVALRTWATAFNSCPGRPDQHRHWHMEVSRRFRDKRGGHFPGHAGVHRRKL